MEELPTIRPEYAGVETLFEGWRVEWRGGGGFESCKLKEGQLKRLPQGSISRL
jgi:hypothetical protein